MKSSIVILTYLWWGGALARVIDHHQIYPNTDMINNVHENTDLIGDESHVNIETGDLVLETIDTVHNLRAVDVQQHTIRLNWTEFIPIGYEGEYELAVSNSTILVGAEWNYKFIGHRTNYTLNNLNADTTYLVRVAIGDEHLINPSDILIIHTPPATQCVHRNEVYPVNRVFIHDDSNICICTRSGNFICEP
jgi:hypothetical protein